MEIRIQIGLNFKCAIRVFANGGIKFCRYVIRQMNCANDD
jgi:hypothetical protein